MKTLTLINPQEAQNLLGSSKEISITTTEGGSSVWINENQASPQVVHATNLIIKLGGDEYTIPLDSFPENSTIELKEFQQEQQSLVLAINDMDVFLDKAGDVTTKQLLEIAQSMPQLLGLTLLGYKNLTDISPIQKLTNLTTLDLRACKNLTDISPIQKLTNLTELNLLFCDNLSDISPIQKLSKLTKLDLSFCENITDISPIQKLSKLTELELRACVNLSDISPIQKLTTLTELNLSQCDNLTDFNPIQNLKNLTKLDLVCCENLTDISPIQKLTNLAELNLSHCDNLTDISPIQKLNNLTSLDLSWCVNLSDISPIQKLSKLTSLDLSWCDNLTDISPVQNLTKLIELVTDLEIPEKADNNIINGTELEVIITGYGIELWTFNSGADYFSWYDDEFGTNYYTQFSENPHKFFSEHNIFKIGFQSDKSWEYFYESLQRVDFILYLEDTEISVSYGGKKIYDNLSFDPNSSSFREVKIKPNSKKTAPISIFNRVRDDVFWTQGYSFYSIYTWNDIENFDINKLSVVISELYQNDVNKSDKIFDYLVYDDKDADNEVYEGSVKSGFDGPFFKEETKK